MKLYKILMSGDGVINIFKSVSNKYPCYLKGNYIYLVTSDSIKKIEKFLMGFFYPHFKIVETGMGAVPDEIALWAGKYFLEEENKRTSKQLKAKEKELEASALKQELVLRTVKELRSMVQESAAKKEGEAED